MPLRRSNWRWMLLGLVVALGCTGRPSRLEPPGVASDAAKAALEKFDGNGDGAIGGAELDRVPSLKRSLKRVDRNGDGKITADEIEQRLKVWSESGLALTRVVAVVKQDGRPLSDAQVTLVPEEFLGPALKPAKGTTDSTGTAHLKISSDPDEAGVHLGFYRVEISRKRPDGTEAIPPRYNTETEFGTEVASDDPSLDRVILEMRGG